MTRHFSPPAPEATALPAMLVDTARCWRDARDSGKSVQPCLARTLDCTMLAPVLDSLYLFYEAALGRSMMVGQALAMTDDEHLLLGLVEGSRPRRCMDYTNDATTALDCAICSTRIMISLTLAAPPRAVC